MRASRLASPVWALFLLLLVPAASAQITLRGTIVDATTQTPLPAATIQIDGTYEGTITNGEGAFALTVARLPVTLVVRYIGYATASTVVTSPSDITLALTPVTLELDEVVVTGEDPAERIMREVIARKQQWRATLETTQADAYNRFTLSNDTGIVSIIESVTTAFWDREEGTREVVKAQRTTNNVIMDSVLPAAMFVANLYDDDIEISGYTFIGVTNPDALRHYDFTLEGYRYRDDQLVYDIGVRPKNRLKSAFVGRVAVLNEAYALLEVELQPNEAFLFPPPIRDFTVTYRQQYDTFGQNYWLPVDFRSSLAVEIAFPGLLKFPTFNVEQVSRLTNYRPNVPVPDSLFTTDDWVAVDSASVAADTLLTKGTVAVPLSAREQVAYATIDSTLTMEKAYTPSGPLARLAQLSARADGDDENGGSNSGSRSGWRQHLSTTPALWYNRVDGGHLGLRVSADLHERVTLRARGSYTTGLDDVFYGGGVRVRPVDPFYVDVDYRTGTDQRYDSHVHGRFLNSLRVLGYGGHDYFDYYRNERFRATLGTRLRRLDTDLAVAFRHEHHSAVEAQTAFDLLGEADPRQLNPAIRPGNLRSVHLRLGINDPGSIPFAFTWQRSFLLEVEHSAPDLFGGDFDFTRVDAVLDWRFPTLVRRRLLPAVLDVRLQGGTARGALPLTRTLTVDGSNMPLSRFGTLRTLEKGPYEGTDYVAAFWEHHFRTLPFELLGLRRIAEAGIGLMVHGGHARTWLDGTTATDAQQQFLIRSSDGWHHELGVSLSGLFGLARLDLTKRLDGSGLTFGLGVARAF